jgi:N-acetylneuraminic acid mutarotase
MQHDSVLRYDVANTLWSAGAPMNPAREGAVAAVIDGTLYVYGGRLTTHPQDAGYRRVIEAYDPVLDVWVARASGEPRRHVGAAAMNGVLYTFGGNNVARALDTVQLYDSVTDNWSGDKPLPLALAYARAEVVGDRIYIFGTNETFEYAP